MQVREQLSRFFHVEPMQTVGGYDDVIILREITMPIRVGQIAHERLSRNAIAFINRGT